MITLFLILIWIQNIGLIYTELICLSFMFKAWNEMLFRSSLQYTHGMFTHAQEHKFSAILGSGEAKM